MSNTENILLEVTRVSKNYELNTPGKSENSFKALQDVSFKLEKGESIGIIGANGSGKSTLLKIISSLTKPSSGTISVHGKINSLIEIGSNFIPDLSGRENVKQFLRLNHIAKSEIDGLTEKIIVFSELNDFIDQAIKYYSSGMFVRLAIAAGFNINADIFVIDEVLMAGDQSFRNKVSKEFKRIKNDGVGLLLASHNPKEIIENCSKVLWLNNGELKFFGDSKAGIQAYYESMAKEFSEKKFTAELPVVPNSFKQFKELSVGLKENEHIVLQNISVEGPGGILSYQNGFQIKLQYKKKETKKKYFPFFKIYDAFQNPVAVINSGNDDKTYTFLQGSQEEIIHINCGFPAHILSKGTYFLELMIGENPKKGELYTKEAFKLDALCEFNIENEEYDYTGDTHKVFVKPKCDWEVLSKD